MSSDSRTNSDAAITAAPQLSTPLDGPFGHRSLVVGKRVLLLASYCGGDNPDCSDRHPCNECLHDDNVAIIETGTIRVLGGLDYVKEYPERVGDDTGSAAGAPGSTSNPDIGIPITEQHQGVTPPQKEEG
jgi:hypothetical protein